MSDRISPVSNYENIICYAPTASHKDGEVELLYEDLRTLMNKEITAHTFVKGDFSAKLGRKQEKSEGYVRNFSYDNRNERGQVRLYFITEHRLYAMNNFFI